MNTGKTSLTDYDFEKPNTSLHGDALRRSDGRTRRASSTIIPANTRPRTRATATPGSGWRSKKSDSRRSAGASNCMGFECGYKFTLTEHFRDQANQRLCSAGARTPRRNEHQLPFGQPDEPFEYTNRFEAIPSPRAFPPAAPGAQAGDPRHSDRGGGGQIRRGDLDRQVRPRQGAVLLGPRRGSDENSSCWIRVAQGWAGKGWGMIYIPRIGQEVIVSFLEGDPDRPLITGSVYNADQMPPYALPDEQTKSTMKSMSSKGGGGFNEIRFEDKKGSEQIFIHGEKDIDIRIKNDRREWIGRTAPDRHQRQDWRRSERDNHVDIVARPDREVRARPSPGHRRQGGDQDHRLAFAHGHRRRDRAIQGNHSSQVTQNLYLKAHAGRDRGRRRASR